MRTRTDEEAGVLFTLMFRTPRKEPPLKSGIYLHPKRSDSPMMQLVETIDTSKPYPWNQEIRQEDVRNVHAWLESPDFKVKSVQQVMLLHFNAFKHRFILPDIVVDYHKIIMETWKRYDQYKDMVKEKYGFFVIHHEEKFTDFAYNVILYIDNNATFSYWDKDFELENWSCHLKQEKIRG